MYKRQEQYVAKVKHLYDNAVDKLLDLAKQTDMPIEGDPFSFSDNPRISEEATATIRQLYSQVYQQIRQGIEAEWEEANIWNDKMVKLIFGAKAKSNNLARWFERNRQAMDTFFARTQAVGGMNLSQRVWKYTSSLRGEMENAISVSIGEGVSAATMSRRVRQYLREPDKLFRRVRGSDGKLRLSKPAQLYHSGRGVYRSSFKNAMRLTRTEINAAYRTADEERWRQLPFVVGYEVKLSNNHPEPDICDDLKGKYPKDFKFSAWHPQCRCFVVPILCTPQEMADLQKRVIAGEDVSTWRPKERIDVPPQKFINWVRDNQERIEAAATKPYFIANNKGLVVKIWNGEPLTPEPPEAKIAQQSKKMLTDAKAAMRGLQSEALDNRFAALEQAIAMPDPDPAQIQKLYERVLQGAATQRKWDALVWEGFTPEQKENLQELEKLLGIRKGRRMSHEQADMGRVNPLYDNPANKGKKKYKISKSGRLIKNKDWDDQYSVNCQTCVPAYMLRRWGFNIEALGNKNGDVWKKLGGGYTNVWKNKAGGIGYGSRYRQASTRTANMFYWLENQPEGIYQIECTWKGGKSGHTWVYVKKKKGGFMYDPQNNKVMTDLKEFKEYSQNVSPKYGYSYFRIDDLRINNTAMSKMVKEYEDRIDPVEAARIKRHATRDEAAIKAAWRNRLKENIQKDLTADMMKSEALKRRISAFEKAVAADDAAAIGREYNRVKQGMKIQTEWSKERAAKLKIEQEAAKIKAQVANYKEIDTDKLDKLMRYHMDKAEPEIAKLKMQATAIEMVKNDIKDLIPDPDKWLKQFTSAELKQAHAAIQSKLSSIAGLPLEEQQKKLAFEIKFVENPSIYKAGAKQYPTWQVSQNAYTLKFQEIQDKIFWKQYDAQYQDLLKFKISSKTKSKKLADALQDYQDAVAVGDKLKASKALSEANSTKASLEKAAAKRAAKNAKPTQPTSFDADAYSQARKDAAMWAKSTKDADARLRTKCGEVWRNATTAEREAIYGYTNEYCNIQEPLRGLTYVGSAEKAKRGLARIPHIESIIDKSSYDFDMWVQRGYTAVALKKFGLTNFNTATDAEIYALVGKEGVEGAYWSCGVSKGSGFSSKPIVFNVYMPKGTKAMYCEPFSAFGCGSGKAWNGLSTQDIFGHESEILLQRGTKLRVTKVEKYHGKWYIDVEVIEQKPLPFPYVGGYPYPY